MRKTRFFSYLKMFRILGFISLVLSCDGASGHYITPCKTGDNECLLSSARAALPVLVQGIPELGLKPLDPLNIPLVNSDHSGLKLQFKNTTLTGVKGCTIENVKHDEAKMKQLLNLKCNLLVSGDYKLKGQLIILPVEGEGKFKIDIRDILFKTHLDLEPVIISGATHWHITKWRQTFKVLTGARFDFENLFNGNRALGDPVIDFANSNWNDVMQEIAPPVVEAIAAKVIDGIEALYAAVPVDQLVKQ